MKKTSCNKAVPFAIGLMFAIHLFKIKKRNAAIKQQDENDANATNEEELIALIIKRRREAEDSYKMPASKRSFIFNDHERARNDIYRDYFSPTCNFNDKQFERNFRITKTIAETIMLECGNASRFFHDTTDALGKRSICPKVKLLMGLKLLAFGAAAPACIEYFRMGLTTARACFRTMIQCIAQSDAFKLKYMRSMNRADAYRVTALHHNQHGIDGIIGSIDCMHIFWKNCPVAWQGAYKGKEKKPSIVLEAMCDYNLWIWHAAFGYAGSQNDINIWEQSPILKSFIDGSFVERVDFPFTINDTTFTKLFMLADGIYPELSRIAKTVDEPRGHGKKLYAKWQESCRKDIERAFGVLQRKFQVLKRPIEQWFIRDINYLVQSTITLHNMMVEHRINKNEKEDISFYAIDDDHHINNIPVVEYDSDMENIQQQNAQIGINRRLQNAHYEGSALNMETIEMEQMESFVTEHHQICNQRWASLYKKDDFFALQNAIIEQLITNEKEREKEKNKNKKKKKNKNKK